MTKSRKIVFSLLIAPIFLALIYLVRLDASSRRDFFGVYSETAKRIVAGEWSLSELVEPTQQASPVSTRFNRGYGTSSKAIFAKLDQDQNGLLAPKEMGKRLASQVFGDATYGEAKPEATLERFTKVLRNSSPSDTLGGDTLAAFPAGRPNAPSGNVGAKRLSASRLFDTTRVFRVAIEMEDEDWSRLCHQTRNHQTATMNPLDKPYTYFKANVVVDGQRISNVAIRKKGFIGSQDTTRPSLKIRFDEFVDQSPIDGLDRLTLNNNKQDRSLVSQTLTYQLFRKAGVPAPRTSFASVSVNGKHLGVYTHVESVRKPFLQHVFGDDSGRLYEGTLADLYPPSIEWLEPKGKAAKDRSGVLRLATILEEESAELEDVAGLVDIDSFVRYWCIESLINFWDGYTQNQNNYFIYERPETGLVCFMPWGADSCFGRRPHFVRQNGGAESIRANGILAHKLFGFPKISTEYREVMLEILETVWNEDELVQEIDRIHALLHDELDTHQISSIVAVDNIKSFIRNRRAAIAPELNDWPQPIASSPRIPRHDVEVAIGRVLFQWRQDRFELSGTMEVEGAQAELTELEFGDDGELTLTCALESRPFELSLRFDDTKPIVDQWAPLTGNFPDGRRGVSATGSLKVTSVVLEADGSQGSGSKEPGVDISSADNAGIDDVGKENTSAAEIQPPQFRAGEITLKVIETRGGFMDRRR